MIPPNSLGYATSYQNIFLVLRELNEVMNGEPRRQRDKLTRKILDTDNHSIEDAFLTKPGESSLLIFPNGFGSNRRISHGRFLDTGERVAQ
jgi:hypothetical protein